MATSRRPFASASRHPIELALLRCCREASRLLPVMLVLILVAACTNPVSDDEEESNPTAVAGAGDSILPMTITEWMYPPDADPATAEPVGVAHLSIAPLSPGDNSIDIVLTNLNGAPLPEAAPPSTTALIVRALEPGAQPATPDVAASDETGAQWSAGTVPLTHQGWYSLTVQLNTGTGMFGMANMYVLVPDPSVHGGGAVAIPETDPEAQAIYDRALEQWADWDAARWRESIGSGTDVLVVTDFTVTDRAGEETAFISESRYTGAFRPKTDGSTPAPPRFDFANGITINDTAWRQRGGGEWEQIPTLGAASMAERADTFSGGTGIQLGGTDRIGGRDAQIITFYLPPKDGQSEAWFAWWVDAETGDLLQLSMVARMHFMIWDFFDVNGSYTITPPLGTPMVTPTTGRG